VQNMVSFTGDSIYMVRPSLKENDSVEIQMSENFHIFHNGTLKTLKPLSGVCAVLANYIKFNRLDIGDDFKHLELLAFDCYFTKIR
jgi:hypothetical protein